MKRILFVCHGNICRSTMAEALAKKYIEENNLNDLFHIESAATSREEIGNSPDTRTLEKLREKNISDKYLYGKKARQVDASEYFEWDFFICMDSNNVRNIKRIFKDDPMKKIFMVADLSKEQNGDIADPWYTRDFQKTFDELNNSIKSILETLK